MLQSLNFKAWGFIDEGFFQKLDPKLARYNASRHGPFPCALVPSPPMTVVFVLT